MSNKLVIPDFYKEKLRDNSSLDGLVNTTIGNFEIWLQKNDMKFFDGYTDHSIEHINNVLNASVTLIREECHEYLTDRDASVFIIACILHDSAMHLSKDGFIDLVNGDYENNFVTGFDDKPWKLLWEDFILESRRFSSRKLVSIFGDPEPVNAPDMSKSNFTDKDYLLIGEFLRRYHHRLAHEIALFGIPGPKKEKLKINAEGDYVFIPDLAGLVARSHGIELRNCFDYLKNNYSSIKEQRKVHAVFLMALLRISDILQIQSNRAPKLLNKIRNLVSPISNLEWDVHNGIKDIKYYEFPETVFIESKPDNIKSYLKTRELLDRIQRELDNSWTVIGEVFAFDRKWKEFGLNIRRVRSNIDDIEKFSESINFLPIKASFEAADTDLLKLLVAPLYGNAPGVGVRELMQNSVDAVRELSEYLKINNLRDLELPNLKGEVVISIIKENDDDYWFNIEDAGIGMNKEVISQFFLKSGASFRKSDLWKKNFEDSEGKSKILRSGRFGVGVLAAYLIGEEIIVSTRHITERFGIEFTTKLEEEFIELKKVRRPIGTSIRIKMNHNAKIQLLREDRESRREEIINWDWYCLTDLKVIRNKFNKQLEQSYSIPRANSKLPVRWYRIFHPEFLDIQWNYRIDKCPKFVCNGIIIQDAEYFRGSPSLDLDSCEFSYPNISVFDPNSNLPLNLQRTDISIKALPFESELKSDIILDFFAHLLIRFPKKFSSKWFNSYNYPGFHNYLNSWLFLKNGATLFADKWFLEENGIDEMFSFFTNSDFSIEHNIFNSLQVHSVACRYNMLGIEYEMGIDEDDPFEIVYVLSHIYQYLKKLSIYKGHTILINKLLYDYKIKRTKYFLKEYRTFLKDTESLKNELNIMFENRYWYVCTLGDTIVNDLLIDFAKNNKFSFNDFKSWSGLIIYSNQLHEHKNNDESIFAKLWKEYMVHPMIPYNMNKRKNLFAQAYKKLEKQIKNQ